MKWLLGLVGLVLVLMGGLWILQGTNVVPVGFMAGHLQYTLLGIVVALAGLLLIIRGFRGQRGTPTH